MHLRTIQYDEFIGQPNEWNLSNSSFSKISLIVGKNASGKSRALNVISGLASLINGEKKAFSSGTYNVTFSSNKDIYNLYFSMDRGIITKETIALNNKVLLTRDENGKGQIFTDEIEQMLKFQSPTDSFVTAIKRDPEQHNFLEPLHEWANSLLHYRFADDDEKRTLVTFSQKEKSQKLKHNSIALLKKGIDKYGDKFTSNILLDFKSLGYAATDIGIKQPDNIIYTDGPPIHCLYVQEEDLNCKTEQTGMSDGMFRALSLLIKLNYVLLDKSDPFLSVDDIGEGLDFKRSKNLIDLVIKKCATENVQLIMSTNDQFVMNGIPLDYWAITDRSGSNVNIINKANSPDVFEKFKFIGLNNFEFLASDYFKH